MLKEPSSPCKSLLADDDEASARYAEAVLCACSCDVHRFSDGAQVLAAMRDESFDIVFLDVHMPCMDGLTALHWIRAMEREQGRARSPVVMIMASAFAEEIRQCIEAGADDVITKPFSVAELRDALSRWTGSVRELDAMNFK